MAQKILGEDLKAGDTIEVWWAPGRDTIIGMDPYTGPLAHLFPSGASIASFAIAQTGMTIDHAADFARIAKATA